MALLFPEDYAWLEEHKLAVTENEPRRSLVFNGFPLPERMYVSGGATREKVDVLYEVPPNYNTEGGDMFWVYPALQRADGKPIPNTSGPGEDSRTLDEVEYLRWSRHWNNRPWKPKVDNIQKIVDRLTWCFALPDAQRT